MTTANMQALYNALCEMISDGGRASDLAEYALFKVQQCKFDLQSCDPAVRSIIKCAFLTKEERIAVLNQCRDIQDSI